MTTPFVYTGLQNDAQLADPHPRYLPSSKNKNLKNLAFNVGISLSHIVSDNLANVETDILDRAIEIHIFEYGLPLIYHIAHT